MGDIHAFDRWLPLRYWFSKRLAGWLNMRLNPNRKFNFDLWPVTLQYIRQLKPDWVLCSGDLTQLSMPGEFAKVMQPWRTILGHCRTVIVPGNHDRYTPDAVVEKSFEAGVGDWAPTKYPDWRQLTDRWHLLALDSTSTHLMDATGAISDEQLQAMQPRLRALSADNGLLLLTHYPMVLPHSRHDTPGHKLRNADVLRRLLADCRASIIYLHGHVHEPWSYRCTDTDIAHIHFLNAGCPTRCSDAHPQGQGFWELCLPDESGHLIELRRHRRVQDQWLAEPKATQSTNRGFPPPAMQTMT